MDPKTPREFGAQEAPKAFDAVDKSLMGKYDVKKYTNKELNEYGPYPLLRYDPPMGFFAKVRTAFMCLFLPFKLVFVIGVFAIIVPILGLVGLGNSAKRPLGAFKRALFTFFIKIAVRSILFVVGFFWISVKGRKHRAKGTARPPFVIANHVSWLDIAMFLYVNGTQAFIAREQTSKIPIIGHFATVMGTLYVSRTPGNREAANAAVRKALKDHADNWKGVGSQVSIWPEGTTTNGKALAEFKHGVFEPGKPVQPILLSYGGPRFSLAWEVLNGWKHMFRMATQVYNTATITFLPVYVPSEEEVADAALYAENVRKMMAKEGGLGMVNGMALREKYIWHDHVRYGCTNKEEYLAARDKLRQEARGGKSPILIKPDGSTVSLN